MHFEGFFIRLLAELRFVYFMIFFSILIELPVYIKNEIQRLCLGLPSADWQSEESLHINLFTFGKLNDLERWNIVDRLGEIEITPFEVKISGVIYSPQRKNTGILSATLVPQQKLELLKNDIYRQLHLLNQPMNEKYLTTFPVIRLGSVKNESSERMAQYFEAHGEFNSSSFEIQDFAWAQWHQTSKRLFYTIEKRYLLE